MKRKLFAWILALTMVFSLAACGGSGKNANSSSMAVADSAPSEAEEGYFDTTDSDDASADSGSTVLKDQKIIYTGTLNLETTEFDAAAKALTELAESLGGYLESSTVGSGGRGYRWADYTVRVPSAQFQGFLDQAGGLAHVTWQNTELQNITETYYDTDGRLKTQQIKLERLQKLLAQAENGALVVRKSGGTMRGLHWGEDDGEKNAPKTADILNPAAVSRFIELTHEAYYRELKEYFGAAIIGFFTDEPSILGRNVSGMFPWTHGFSEIFRRAGGNAANLTALFDGRENDDTRLYHKLLLQREGEVYYGTLSRWCEAHGIGLMGHPHQSDDIEVEKYFAVPGQDLVLRWLAPEKDGLAGIDSTMAKCSADAARLMHRRRNANECFGACNKDDNPWQLSGGDIKWYTDWLAVRGVNLFIPHAFYYSICGKRKDERPPDVGPHSIWWAHYEAWSTYWRRLSWLMTDIDLHAEAAVLCRNRDLCPDTVRPLFERQIGFQYIPESYFPACTVEDGALWLHGHRYTAVLGDKALFPDAAHPEVSALEPDCRCDPPQPMLRCASFNKEGRACWLLVNEGNTPIKTRLTLPVDAPLCRYDLWNGQPCACPAERTAKGACLPLELPARGSLLLFTCTARESEALPLPPTYLSLAAPDFTLADEDAAHLTKTYRATLQITATELQTATPLLTLPGQEMAELTVNGQPAGVSFWPPHKFPLAGLLTPGKNTLTLTLTGSPANRYGKHPVPYGLDT